MENSSIHPTAITIALAFIILVFAVIMWGGCSYRLYMHSLGREMGKAGTMLQTAGLPEIKGRYFIVKYYPGDKEQAQMVLQAAEKFIQPVSQKLKYTPRGKEIIIVYPTREKLNAYFGWPADESAMGVYWAGTIRVLAPREWVDTEDGREAWNKFVNSGPMAHEIAHLVVDHRTKGNYNRWFTEGVAQYVELELTGFRFRDPAGSLENNRYSLQQLSDNFDRLPNQSLAYRQSLAAVYYLVHRYGEDSLVEIMDLLAEGAALDQALQKVCRLNLPDFENKLNDWLDKNWSMFS